MVVELIGAFPMVGFEIESTTSNFVAREITRSVLRNGLFQSYLALGGPSWLQDRIRQEMMSDDESDDGDEDDTEALMAELDQIKKERVEERLRKEKQQQMEELNAKEEELLKGNPLLNNAPTSFSVKRRWDDDVVFKNQARGEMKAPKRFINDTIRNDFHRKFLHRYMK